MPRTTRPTVTPSNPLPFPSATQDSARTFVQRTDVQRSAVAKAVAADKASGLSGNELRAKYGEALTGPARRKLLRTYGLDSPATIARSYDAYRDGDARKGTRHAREHGANRASGETEAPAEPVLSDADAKVARKALRAAGETVPRDARKLYLAAHALGEKLAEEASVAAAARKPRKRTRKAA